MQRQPALLVLSLLLLCAAHAGAAARPVDFRKTAAEWTRGATGRADRVSALYTRVRDTIAEQPTEFG